MLGGNGAKNFDKDSAFSALCSLDLSMALLSSPDDAIGSKAIFTKADNLASKLNADTY